MDQAPRWSIVGLIAALVLVGLPGAVLLQATAPDSDDAVYRVPAWGSLASETRLTWDHGSIQLPATLPVYELGLDPAPPWEAWQVAGRLGIEDRRLLPGGDPEHAAWIVTGSIGEQAAEVQLEMLTSILRFERSQPFPPDGLPDDATAVERARAFLQDHELVPDHASLVLEPTTVGPGTTHAHCRTSSGATPEVRNATEAERHPTEEATGNATGPNATSTRAPTGARCSGFVGELRVHLTREVAGYPVWRSSGADVRLGHQGHVVDAVVRLPPLTPVDELPLLPVAAVQDHVTDRHPAVGTEATILCETLHMDRVELQYVVPMHGDDGQRAFPVYVFTGACQDTGPPEGDRQVVTIVAPAIQAAYQAAAPASATSGTGGGQGVVVG